MKKIRKCILDFGKNTELKVWINATVNPCFTITEILPTRK